MKLATFFLAALALPLAASATTGSITAEATASMPVFALIDLDPDDGVTPTIEWTSQTASLGYEDYSEAYRHTTYHVLSGGWDSSLSADVDNAYFSLSASRLGSTVHLLTTLKAPSYTFQTEDGMRNGFGPKLSLDGTFTITGKGKLVAYVDLEQANRGDLGMVGGTGYSCDPDYAHCTYWSYFPADNVGSTLTLGNLAPGDTTYTRCFVVSGSSPDCTGKSTSLVYDVFVNETGGSASGRFDMDTQLYMLATVPEPETWATLLAGLGLVVARARRRGAQRG